MSERCFAFRGVRAEAMDGCPGLSWDSGQLKQNLGISDKRRAASCALTETEPRKQQARQSQPPGEGCAPWVHSCDISERVLERTSFVNCTEIQNPLPGLHQLPRHSDKTNSVCSREACGAKEECPAEGHLTNTLTSLAPPPGPWENTAEESTLPLLISCFSDLSPFPPSASSVPPRLP